MTLLAEFGLWGLVVAGGLAVLFPQWGLKARIDVVVAVVGSALFVALGVAFVAQVWSLAYVADHARSGSGPLLRLSGSWAGAEGSLLLWTVMVAWASVTARVLLGRRFPARIGAARWVLRLGSGLTAAYGLVLVLTASPFKRLDVPPVDGLGLQPVLEYPAMVWHPPLLYAGLVGLLVPALAAAALAFGSDHPMAVVVPAGGGDADGGTGGTGNDGTAGENDGGPRSLAQGRAMAWPVAVLTAGLATGAVWANVELGWGGYWAWDPVESAGLVAWLLGAAALHGVARGGLSGRLVTILLIAPGLAALWASTLTRIGVVASVHAFADRPGMRVGLLTVAFGASVVVAASIVRSAVSFAGSGPGSGPGSVHGGGTGARRAATAVLVAAAVFVAVGTYEPLVEAATSGDRVAIAGQYYTRLLWPVSVVGVGLALRADRRWWPAVVGAALGALATPAGAGPFAVLLGASGGAVAVSAVSLLKARRRGALAHVGVGLILVGVAGTVATEVTTVHLVAGTTVTVDGTELTHRAIELIEGDTTRTAQATLEIDGEIFQPSLVAFDLRGVSTAEVARAMHGFDELQVVLLDGDAETASYRINRLPRVGLVWLGALVLLVGVAVQPLRRRLRASNSDNVDDASTSSPSPLGVDPDAGAAVVGGPDGGEVGAADGGAPLSDGAVLLVDDADAAGDGDSGR